VSAARDAKNQIEFEFSDPEVFKKLFSFFKGIKATEIYLRFTPKNLTFFTQDQKMTLRVVAHFNGSQATRYYCEGTFWMSVSNDSVKAIFASINKSFMSIRLEKSPLEEEELVITLIDPSVQKNCNYRVRTNDCASDCVKSLQQAEATIASLGNDKMDGNCVLAFTLSTQLLKKTMNDSANVGDNITIEKSGDYYLRFLVVSPQVQYEELYENSEAIKLTSMVGKNELFRCSTGTKSLCALADAVPTDDVRIMIPHPSRDEMSVPNIICRSVLDERLTIWTVVSAATAPAGAAAAR
jgi:hypothetical protein